MKTNSRIFSVVLLLLANVLAYAASPVKFTISSYGASGIFKLTYKSTEKGKVKVSIFSESKELIFTETLTNVESFDRPYNLSSLPQGVYTFVVEDKNGKEEQTVNYSVNKKVVSTFEVNKIANESNKYLLTVQNTESDLIQVRIYDNQNNLLHEQAMTVTGKFSVVYNLDKIKTSPTFVVSGSNGEAKTINFQ